jgi:hypothetical protein
MEAHSVVRRRSSHIFWTVVLQMTARLSALRGGRPLPPGRFLVLISVRGRVNPRAIVRLEGIGQLKNPVTWSVIETATFRLVAQCSNQLRYHVPSNREELYRGSVCWRKFGYRDSNSFSKERAGQGDMVTKQSWTRRHWYYHTLWTLING